ncbi:hypothetical protein ACROYT_G039790 [Oculina patagonica]
MRKLILLMTIALACQVSKGYSSGFNPTAPTGSVTCNDDHTVSITISDVDDLDEWSAPAWQLESSDSCEPTFTDATTVTYSSLSLPDCSESSEQLSDGIKYILKINPTVTDQLQSRSYEHLYYVSCKYDNDDNVVASFVPIKHRTDNDTSTASFTFSLGVYTSPGFTGDVPNPVALDKTLYFKASVTTASNKPNLDLYPTSCWSSASSSASSTDKKVTLIANGCGHAALSGDLDDTLSYTCADDSTDETFSISSFRYVGASDGDSVYFHCSLIVCLADEGPSSACECPKVCGQKRKRRSFDEIVDESKVYHVSAGPFFFVEEDEKEHGEVDDEGGADKQDEFQLANLAIVVAVCGVVIMAIVCATIYLCVRNRRQHRRHDLSSVLTELTAPISSPSDLESPII